MGYARQSAPHVIESATIVKFIGEREIANVIRSVDPFRCDDPCELSPTRRHYAIGSCGDVVCRYCSKIWS